MPIPESLLSVLRCPKSHTALRVADSAEAVALAGRWSQANHPLPPTGFLLSADGAWAYPERDGVPCLLLDEAIAR